MQQIHAAPAAGGMSPGASGAFGRASGGRAWLKRWLPPKGWLLQRGLPQGTELRLRRKLPLAVLAVAVVAQVILPDPVWVMVIVTLTALHIAGYLWARAMATGIASGRKRELSLILAGDELEEEFTIANHSIVPLLWLEVQDLGDFPGYNVGRVVPCAPRSEVRWRTRTLCNQRGLFRLGPLAFATGDPFRLFTVGFANPESEPVLIYPKVLHLPEITLARGHADAEARVYRHLQGALPAPTVREHVPSEGLRHVHWPATAHHGKLMVRERQQEPAGDIWIVVDSCLPGAQFERVVTFAASAAAQILDSAQRRKVGMLVASGSTPRLVIVPPDNGSAHIWQILAELARVQRSTVDLASMLQEARGHMGARTSLVVITGSEQPPEAAEYWIAGIVRGDRRAASASVLLATTPQRTGTSDAILAMLARHDIPALLLPDDLVLPARGMVRRTRRVVKSTPTGGSYVVEVEEEA